MPSKRRLRDKKRREKPRPSEESPPSSSAPSSSSSSSAPPLSLPSALSSADELMGCADFASALSLLSPFLASHPSSAALHLSLAHCHLGEGAVDEAAFHLTTSCDLEPDAEPHKWMELAQLKGGEEALAAFQRGVDLLQAQKEALLAGSQRGGGDSTGPDGGSVAASLEELRQSLSVAFVSMAELLVTDCCDSADAEPRCEALLAAAVGEWKDNPEALFAYANLRLIQGDEDEARQWAARAVAALKQSEGSDAATRPALEVLRSSAASIPPSYELRLNVAKLCYELRDWTPAAALLDRCLDDDDRFIEVHHLAALTAMQQSRWRQARTHAERALALIRAAESEDPMGEAKKELSGIARTLTQLLTQWEGEGDGEEEAEEEEGEGEEAADGAFSDDEGADAEMIEGDG